MIENLTEVINFDQTKQDELNRRMNLTTNYILQELTIDNIEEICDIYASFDDKKEFLYIPSFNEIVNTLESKNSSYIGFITPEQKILGLAKIEHIKESGAFFVAPEFEQDGKRNFFGFSGLIVRPQIRKQGIGKELTIRTGRVLHRLGATGFYADCDYRNEKSYGTLSKTMSFLGFTDGRQGAPGEQTIYTTFYKSFNEDNVHYNGGLSLNFYEATKFDDIVNILKEKMNSYGGYTSTKIPYGGGFNTIYVLKNKVNTTLERAKLILPKNEINSPQDIRLQNSNDNSIIAMQRKAQGGR